MLPYRNKLDYSGTFTYKGEIFSSDQFPDSGTPQQGWGYKVGADVTDNDPTKTNTGIHVHEHDNGLVWDNGAWKLFQIIEAQQELDGHWTCRLVDAGINFTMPNPNHPDLQFADVYEQIV